MLAFARLAFPLVFAGLLLLAAVLWPGTFRGSQVEQEGLLLGPLVTRTNGLADLITSIAHELTLTPVSGSPLVLRFRDYHPLQDSPVNSAAAAFLRSGGTATGLGPFDRRITAVLGSPLEGLAVAESTTGHFDLAAPPAFPLAAAPAATELETRSANAAWTWRVAPGERRRPTAASSPQASSPGLYFASLSREALVTPLFSLASSPAIHRAPFGRLGALHPAAPPFTAARGFIDDSGAAWLIPVVGETFAGLPVLERFSRICEVFFTRTAYPFVFALGSLLTLVAGTLTWCYRSTD